MLPPDTKVGFIGIGAMGEPMARTLLRNGYAVTAAVHRRRERLERLLPDGLRESGDAAAVAAASNVVIICVPDAPQVEGVFFSAGGLLRGAAPDTLFIDMSTISPVATRAIAQRVRDAGHRFIDAPVSGGPQRAKDGTLTIMVGGSAEDFARAKPLLQALGSCTHLGPVGMGETVKLVNQVMISIIMLANAEGLTFAQRAGADVSEVRKVIATATGANYLLENWLPKTWFAGRFDGGFAMDLLRKDLRAALDAAREAEMPMPASDLAYQIFTAQSEKGDGALDYSAVVKFYERNG